jgi:formylglycine-generating enzyme required for sulfatase activity
MVVAQAGSFTMGSPESEPERRGSESQQLKVTIVQSFAVGKLAVTRGEFAEFVTATGHRADGGCFAWTGTEWKLQADCNWRSRGFAHQNDGHPVVCAKWDDAKAYVAWLARKTAKSYPLLSECGARVRDTGQYDDAVLTELVDLTHTNYYGDAVP